MKTSLPFFLFTTAAQSHESLAPHSHPHSASLLLDPDTFIVAGIVTIAAALVAYAKFGARS